MKQTRKPTSPGEIIRAHYLEPLNLTVNMLAENLAVNTDRLSEIVEGKRSVDVNMAMRLSRALATTPEPLAQSSSQAGFMASTAGSGKMGECKTFAKSSGNSGVIKFWSSR